MIFIRAVVPIINSTSEIRFEVICIDDGSKDNTLSKLMHLAESDARLSVVELSRNFGKEAALTAGIEAARGDAIIPIDADLQDPPERIPIMINKWREGADVVLARRIDRSSDSFLKRKTAELFIKSIITFRTLIYRKMLVIID